MALSGWNPDNKLKLTIDGSKIEGDLTNFPVSITLSSGTGQTGFDATVVFDELTASGTDRKKIAITDSSDNQLYIEIERWDYGNEEANLWVKVPTISSGTSTDLYLYYDATVSGNTSYVGDTGDAAAQNVWDTNFKGVWHMAQDPNGDVANAIKDSTSNVIHATPVGSMTSADLVDGKVGKGIDFDGTDDYIDVGDVSILDGAVACTFEIILNRTSFTVDGAFIRKWAPGQQSFTFGQSMSSSAQLRMLINDTGAVNILVGETTDANIANSTTVYAVGVWGGSNTLTIYENAVSKNISYDAQNTPVSIADTTEHLSLSGRYNAGSPDLFTNGVSDEVRISNTARSVAWIKATYYSNWDNFVTFDESTYALFTFSNPIPTDLSTVYGTTQQLYLTTTISGDKPNYNYDAVFYDAYNDSQVGSTVSGIQSGQPANVLMNTTSGIDYQWYMTATSSGVEDTSLTYTFTNKFLCEGQTQVNNVPASGIPVRLYRRSTGEYIGGDISAGVSGTFEIETNYNEYHYAIALYNNTTANAIIQDWLIP